MAICAVNWASRALSGCFYGVVARWTFVDARLACNSKLVYRCNCGDVEDASFARGAVNATRPRCLSATLEWSRAMRRCRQRHQRRRRRQRRITRCLDVPVMKRIGRCSWHSASLVTTPRSNTSIVLVRLGEWRSGYVCMYVHTYVRARIRSMLVAIATMIKLVTG